MALKGFNLQAIIMPYLRRLVTGLTAVFVEDKMALGQILSEQHSSPCKISVHQMLTFIPSVIRDWYNEPKYLGTQSDPTRRIRDRAYQWKAYV
jgi:hypothetical protein